MDNIPNPDARVDRVSLVYHLEIADRIEQDPTLIQVALTNLDRWLERKGH